MQTLPDIPPDFSPHYEIKANVTTSQFGDGYEQSRPAGLNHIKRRYSLQWSMLMQAEYATLHDFLLPRLNLEPFKWTAPWDDSERQWKCRAINGPRPTSARFSTLSATFEEDFTP